MVYILNVITLGTVSLPLHHRLFLYELWRENMWGCLKKKKKKKKEPRKITVFTLIQIASFRELYFA